VDVVAPYVTLKQTGSYFKGLSPFNHEKTPSFFVHPDKNFFKCYSSGNSGDIFRFIQLKENLAFPEAVEVLANRFNIPLEYEDGQDKESMSERKELFDIHEIAAEHYRKAFLADTKEGAWIRNYWEKDRSFLLNTAKEYGVGYAPLDGRDLLNELLEKKFSKEALTSCGLFYTGKGNNRPENWHPRFQGRLMISIKDIQGRVIAFTGRALEITPEKDPARDAKYINSPETPLFSKSHVLFGLDNARQHIAQENHFLLVEGQLDAIRCWEKGLKTAVAPQGTSITMEQMGLLRRYASNITCFLDGDRAGKKAALRMLPMAIKAGLDVQFLPLKEQEDPDAFLSSYPKDDIKAYLEKSVISAMTFAIGMYFPKDRTLTSREKTDGIEQLFEIITCTNSAIMQDEYLDEIYRLTHINRQTLQADFQTFKRNKKIQNEPENALYTTAKEVINTDSGNNEKLTTVEYQLLLLILNQEEIAKKIAEVVNPDWIMSSDLYGTLLRRVLAEIREGEWDGSDKMNDLLENDAERDIIYSLLLDDLPFDEPKRTANMCIKQLYKQYIHARRDQLDQRIANLGNGEQEEVINLQNERVKLRKALSAAPAIK